ncbi:MAG: hypothetical protein QW100_03605 [Thermoplasmatales archaeon]
MTIEEQLKRNLRSECERLRNSNIPEETKKKIQEFFIILEHILSLTKTYPQKP